MEVFIVNSILNHAHFYFLCYGGWIVAGCWSFAVFSLYFASSRLFGTDSKACGGNDGKRRRRSNNSIRSAYRKICNYKQCLKKKKGGKIMKLKRKCSIVLGFVVVVFVCAFFSLDGFYLLASHNPFHWLSPKNSLYLQKFLLSPSSAVSKFNLFHFEFFYLSTK